MKIQFRVGDKANAQVLKSVIDVANSKTPEYLEFVSMEFVSDTEVKLVSTNLQISISSILNLSAPCERFETVLVHKADLSHLVSICKDQITLDTDKAKATCGKINLSLKVLDAKNYPEIKSLDAPSEMPIWSEEELEDLRLAIKILSPFVSTEEARARLCGINFKSDVSTGKIVLSATNGHVAGTVQLLKKAYVDMDCIVPHQSFKILQSFLKTTAFPALFATNSSLILHDTIQTLMIRLIDESFVDIDQIIPKTFDYDFPITEELLGCLHDGTTIATSQGSVKLSFDESKNFSVLVYGADRGEVLYEYNNLVSESIYTKSFALSYLIGGIAHCSTIKDRSNELSPMVAKSLDGRVTTITMARRT